MVQRISFKSSVLCTRGREASSAGTRHALIRERSSLTPSLQRTLPGSCQCTRGERAGNVKEKHETLIPQRGETEVPRNPSTVLCVLGGNVLPPPHFRDNPLTAMIPAWPGAAPPHLRGRCTLRGSQQGKSKCCWRVFEKAGPLSSLTISREAFSPSYCLQLAPYRGCKFTCSHLPVSCLPPGAPGPRQAGDIVVLISTLRVIRQCQDTWERITQPDWAALIVSGLQMPPRHFTEWDSRQTQYLHQLCLLLQTHRYLYLADTPL